MEPAGVCPVNEEVQGTSVLEGTQLPLSGLKKGLKTVGWLWSGPAVGL